MSRSTIIPVIFEADGKKPLPVMLSIICAGLIGSVSALNTPLTSHLPWATLSTSYTICPKFISGTIIALTCFDNSSTAFSGNGQIVKGRRRPALIPFFLSSFTANLADFAETPYANTPISASSRYNSSFLQILSLLLSTFLKSLRPASSISFVLFVDNNRDKICKNEELYH